MNFLSEFTPIKSQSHMGGVQHLFKFDNGYGASVIRHMGSCGYRDGKWELAVIIFEGDEYELCYDTPITDDVLGHLDEEDIIKTLTQIQNLQ